MDQRGVKRLILTILAMVGALLVLEGASSTDLSFAPQAPFPSDTLTQKGTSGEKRNKERVYIENVDLWSYNKEVNPDAQILRGNVIFFHKEAYMYCDSALLYEGKNSFEAYGNVRIDQGDSVHIYCDYLDYNGATMLARLRDHVRMEHGGNTLFTDSLDYNRQLGIGYYFDNGTIVDSLNTLKSVYGEYSTVTRTAVFNEEVVLENPNFTMYSDTLHYDTTTKIATILGATRIEGDSGYILSTRGRYYTEADQAILLDRSELYSGTRRMTGDSLFYDRKQQTARMFRNVVIRDTADHISMNGHYAEYHEDTGFGTASDSAYVMEYSSKDTLYAHATVMELHKKDSANVVKGLGNVRLFRSDVQGVSDSLLFLSADSTITSYGHPFMWSGASQITGDTIRLYLKNGAADQAHIFENAYASRHVRGDYYDQMRGTEIRAYFKDNKIDSLATIGNAETIYYNVERDSTVSGQVTSQSSAILMEFANDEIERIKLLDKTVGVLTPIDLLKPEKYYYPSFVWFPQGRPVSFQDIFRVTPRPETPMGSPSQESVPMGSSQAASSAPEELMPSSNLKK